MNWWIVGALLIFAFLLFKFKDIRHRVSWFFIILVIVFLVASFGIVSNSNDIDLGTFDGVVKAGNLYFSWIGSIVGKIGSISSYAINQDWHLNSTTGK